MTDINKPASSSRKLYSEFDTYQAKREALLQKEAELDRILADLMWCDGPQIAEDLHEMEINHQAIMTELAQLDNRMHPGIDNHYKLSAWEDFINNLEI